MMANQNQEEQSRKLLTPTEAAEILTLSPKTLAKWRCLRVGPPWIKIGGSVRYRAADISDYIAGLAA